MNLHFLPSQGIFKTLARRSSFHQLLLAVATLAVLAWSSTQDAAAAAPPLEWLHVEENRIVNESGERVILRGINIEGWNWHWHSSRTLEYERRAITEATTPAPNGWGANVILIAFASGPVNREDSTYLAYLDEMVEQAKRNGAYTLLVWRSHEPDGSQPNMPNQAAEDALATLADRYADEPAVLYGLQVEPHDVSWERLKPRFTSMIDAIREHNPRALILVPGTYWGRYVFWMLDDPIDRENLVLKSHVYDGWSEISGKYRLPEVAERYPVLLGEFGAGGRTTQREVDRLLDMAESLEMSWVGWLFQDRGCPCMLRSTSTFEPTPYGRSLKDRMQTASLAAQGSEVQTPPVRINVGGPAVTDTEGNVWLADQPYAGGAGWGYVDTRSRSGTAGHEAGGGVLAMALPLDAMMVTERWGLDGYRVELPNGTYDVRLHFMETYTGINGPGQRVFDVLVEGRAVASDLDVYAQAGFANPLAKEIPGIHVTDGVLDVRFRARTEHPTLKAIEVLPAGTFAASRD